MPYPQFTGHVVTWASWLGPGKRGFDFEALDPRSGRRRRLAHDVRWDGFAIDGRRQVFAVTKWPTPDRYTDWIETSVGHIVRKLSWSGHSEGMTYADGVVGWRDPDIGEPKVMYLRSVKPGSRPVVLAGHRELGDGGGGELQLGDQFAVYTPGTANALVAVPWRAHAPWTKLATYTSVCPACVSIDGRRLAWGTTVPKKKGGPGVQVHLATVRVSR